jgi:hypothetical protein
VRLHPVTRPTTSASGLDETTLGGLAGRSTSFALVLGIAIGLASAGALVAPSIAAGELPGQLTMTLAFLALAAPVIAAAVFAKLVAAPRRARSELAWLATLPFPFAHEGYLAALAQHGDRVGFDLVLHFERAVTTDVLAASIEAAGLDQAPRARGATTFAVATPQFESRHESSTRNTTSTWYDTSPLHRWFRDRAVPLLIALSREHGLRSVEIEY